MLKRHLLLYLSVFGLLLLLSCRKKQPEIIEPPDPFAIMGTPMPSA